MRLRRCFSPVPLASGSVVQLPDSAGAHLVRVLRLRAGEDLTLFDGRGGEYAARLLSAARGCIRVEVGEHRALEREPPLRLMLLQCLARGERMDWIVQKATELGVSAIAPIASRHSVVQLDAVARERRLAHWRNIVTGACEQCGRNRLPEVLPISALAEACDTLEPSLRRLCLSPGARESLSTTLAPRTGAHAPAHPGTDTAADTAAAPSGELQRRGVALLVGPEGGLSADEEEHLRRRGFTPCRLGPRILRAETAPIAALAALQALAGDFA